MRIAILDLCVWLPEYQSGQPKFGELLAQWGARGLPEATFSVIAVVEGAPLPPVDTYDGFVLSGSDKGVYDDTDWMAPLRAFLVDAKAAGKPLFGVCFGHQLMADVFGGKAEKVGAPEVGVRDFEIEGEAVTGHVWHQDQVTKVPPGAEVIGSADYCPVAALSYDFPAMSVQFHPEYAPDYVSDFLRRSNNAVLDKDISDPAIKQLDESDVSADLFAAQMGAFFRDSLSAKV